MEIFTKIKYIVSTNFFVLSLMVFVFLVPVFFSISSTVVAKSPSVVTDKSDSISLSLNTNNLAAQFIPGDKVSTAAGTTCTFNGSTYTADNINLYRNTDGVCTQLGSGACPILYPDNTREWNVITNNCKQITCTFGGQLYPIDNVNLGKNGDGTCSLLASGSCNILYTENTREWNSGTSSCDQKTCFLNGNYYPVDNITYYRYDLTGVCVQVTPEACTTLFPNNTREWSTATNNCQPITCTYNGSIYNIDNVNIGKSLNGTCTLLASGACDIIYTPGTYSWNSGSSTCSPLPTPTLTPMPATPTPAPACTTKTGTNLISNKGFETGNFTNWNIDNSNGTPTVSSAQSKTGTYSALVGNVSGVEPTGDSSIYQTLSVPSTGGELNFFYWPYTQDSITYDWQDVQILNTSGVVLATLMHTSDNSQTWKSATFSLNDYASQTVRIRFLVHQDGAADLTGMYIDDVTFEGCATGGATATDTPAPTSTMVPTNTLVPTNTIFPTQFVQLDDTVYVNSGSFNYGGADQTVNVHRPRFIGTDSSASYVIIQPDNLTVIVTPDVNGDWSFIMDTPLAEGAHTVTAYNSSDQVLGSNDFNVRSNVSMLVNLSNDVKNASGINVTLNWVNVHAYNSGDTLTINWPADVTNGATTFGQSSAFVTGDITRPANFNLTSSSTGTITFTAAGTIAANTNISVVLGGGKLSNPTMSGNYTFTFNSTQANALFSDSATGFAYVGDANRVHITARINSSLSFNINDENDGVLSTFPAGCNLGTLDTRFINTCKYRLKVATNSENGFVVSMVSSADGLNNGTYSFDSAPADLTLFTAGVEAYGANIQPGSVTGANQGSTSATSIATCSSNCNTSGIKYQSETPFSIYESIRGNAPSATDLVNTALVTHVATPSATTPAGTYAQTITYSIVGRF